MNSYTYESAASNLTRKLPLNESYPRILPQWMKNDKQVLKFNGFFVEHVVESSYENYRIRKLNIFFYLEDNTVHIDEIREENSGIVQGYFSKRSRVEKPCKSGFIGWEDLNVGQNFEVYGKVVHITSCDEFTRKFLVENSVDVPSNEEIPEVQQENKFKNVDVARNKKTISELKEYIEVKLGGGHPNQRLKQFLQNDGKVLHFDVLWYDDRYDKEEKFFKMNYYLADGMVFL